MNFDTVIDRGGTGALKWNAPKKTGAADVVPLWVADMDFAAPEAVVSALRTRIDHPIFGYTNPDPEYFETLRAWYSSRYGAKADSKAFLLGPGVVPAMGIAVRAFTAPGEGVLIMPPVYYPFAEITHDNDRVVIEAPLDAENPFRMRLDLVRAQKAVAEAASRGLKIRVLLFCSPHNPGGVVWEKAELAEVLKLAESNDLIVIADEIHGDLVFKQNGFTSLVGFPGAAARTVVISASNKTFNLAGLHLSHFVVEDEALRATLARSVAAAGYSQPNVLSLVASQAAYEKGGPWLDELIAYLRGNVEFAVDFLSKKVPLVKTAVPDGTYLIWVDASRLIAAKGLADDRELVARLTDEARVRFTAGGIFGTGGGGFIRINAASPRSLLKDGLERFSSWAAAK